MLWDLGSGNIVKETASHEERVWAVSLNDYTATTASLDRSIAVHSFLPEDLRFAGWPDETC
eukprot:gene21120-28011_t